MRKSIIKIVCVIGVLAVIGVAFFLFHPHKYTLIGSKEPTCTESGYKTFKCWCGKEYTESTDPIAHVYETTIVEPTCTEAGKTVFVCKNCGDTYEEEGKAKIDHEYEETVDVERGKKVFVCKHCGDTYEEDIVVAETEDEEQGEKTDNKQQQGKTDTTQQQQQVQVQQPVAQPTPLPQPQEDVVVSSGDDWAAAGWGDIPTIDDNIDDFYNGTWDSSGWEGWTAE